MVAYLVDKAELFMVVLAAVTLLSLAITPIFV